MGRFINADGYIGANGDIPGYNLFAYCSNNPVIHSDYNGNGFFSDLWDGICDAAQVVWDTVKEVADAAGDVINNVAEDIYNLDLFNDNEQKVIEAHYFSCYKGHPAIKLPIGDNAFSFGALFVGNEVHDTETIKHEYGHAVHFDQIGPIKYALFVGIPSLVGYWSNVPYNEYYSQPWEYIADSLGGVQRTNGSGPYVYSANARSSALQWWCFSKYPLLTAIVGLMN